MQAGCGQDGQGHRPPVLTPGGRGRLHRGRLPWMEIASVHLLPMGASIALAVVAGVRPVLTAGQHGRPVLAASADGRTWLARGDHPQRMAWAARRGRPPSWRVIRLPHPRRMLVLVTPGVAG